MNLYDIPEELSRLPEIRMKLAGMAMQGMLSNPVVVRVVNEEAINAIAAASILAANALIKELSK